MIADSMNDTKWRIIPLEEHDAFTNMALDEAASEALSRGQKNRDNIRHDEHDEAIASDSEAPTIRFYKWKPSAVSIGCFQSMEDEIDLDVCKKLNVDTVRRRTGGGAVYHDNFGEITYSVIAPESMFPKNIIESYKIICGWIIDSLALIGLQASFIPINDIIVNNKKISGNAQTRRNRILLQHGTILYDVDVKKMFSLLRVPDEKIMDKMIATVEERVTSITKQNNAITKDHLYEALVKGFTNNKQWQFGKWSDSEMQRAQELAKIRYSTKDWNFSR